MHRTTPRAPRAVLVDMDDTLFDHSLTCRAAIARLRRDEPYLRSRGLDALWRDYLELLNVTVPGDPLVPGSVAPARRERWRRLAGTCGRRLSSEQASDLSQRYREEYQAARRPVAGAPALLEELHRRARLVVVTNNQLAEQEEKLRFLGLGDHVDGLVVSAGVGVAKPARRIFDVALSVADARPSEAVMLGDSWDSDVEGARGAGIRAVWLNRFADARRSTAPAAELTALTPLRSVLRTVLTA